MALAMDDIPAQMTRDRHDPVSTGEARAAVEALRVMTERCAAAGINPSVALAAFRVTQHEPVNVAELRRAYHQTQLQVTRVYDLAVAKERDCTTRSAELEARAAALDGDQDGSGQATELRAEAADLRRKARLSATAAQSAYTALERLQLGHRGLHRCHPLENAYQLFRNNGGKPAQWTRVYAHA